MKVSVVVPTFNRRELVARTLEALFAQHFLPSEFEIIVVVDGSKDGTAEALRQLKPACEFKVIEQENRGLAGARNTGFRAAESTLVLFLDDDMLCDSELVAAHCAAHENGGRIAAFGALFLSQDSPRSLAAECFNREIGAFHLERKRNPAMPLHARDCVFSNASLSRELLMAMGGFDEEFRMREDLEFGTRLFANDVTPKYVENAVAYQYYDKNADDLIREAEAFAIADVCYELKHSHSESIGELRWMRNDPKWKQLLRRMIAQSPGAVDLCMAPLCGLGERFFRARLFRDLGVRALQLRRRAHWLHKAMEIYPEL